MDRIIEITVGGNYLTKDNKVAGVRGEGNVTNLRITFYEDWDNYAKKITFWNAQGSNPVERILTTDLLESESTRIYIVPIPAEPMEESGVFTFVIEGYLDGKRQRCIPGELEVKYAPIVAGTPLDPIPTQAEQLQVQIDGIKETILSSIEAEKVAVEAKEGAVKAAEGIMNMSVSAETLKTGEQAFAQKTEREGVVNLHFGLPAGNKGDKGQQGIQGEKGDKGDGVNFVDSLENITEEGLYSVNGEIYIAKWGEWDTDLAKPFKYIGEGAIPVYDFNEGTIETIGGSGGVPLLKYANTWANHDGGTYILLRLDNENFSVYVSEMANDKPSYVGDYSFIGDDANNIDLSGLITEQYTHGLGEDIFGNWAKIKQYFTMLDVQKVATKKDVDENDALPPVTDADAGKFLRVSASGVWEVQAIENGNEVAY